MNAKNVGKPLLVSLTLLDIPSHTPVLGIMNAKNVEKDSLESLTLADIPLHILGLRIMNAKNVEKPSQKSLTSFHTPLHTLVWGVINANAKNVEKFTHLTTQLLTHPGVRNYKCQEYGKRFTEESNLTTYPSRTTPH